MPPILRNILAVIIGVIIGSMTNMAIIKLSGQVIPPPEGVDVTNMESLKANMHLFQSEHYIMPFLAHAAGTFVGASLAVLIAASHKMKFALGIACFFLLGGITNAYLLPAPVWFIVVDLMVAYLPMGWLAGRLFIRDSSTPRQMA
jgi:hypothetical protein